jgi:hypothetical protein
MEDALADTITIMPVRISSVSYILIQIGSLAWPTVRRSALAAVLMN